MIPRTPPKPRCLGRRWEDERLLVQPPGVELLDHQASAFLIRCFSVAGGSIEPGLLPLVLTRALRWRQRPNSAAAGSLA